MILETTVPANGRRELKWEIRPARVGLVPVHATSAQRSPRVTGVTRWIAREQEQPRAALRQGARRADGAGRDLEQAAVVVGRVGQLDRERDLPLGVAVRCRRPNATTGSGRRGRSAPPGWLRTPGRRRCSKRAAASANSASSRAKSQAVSASRASGGSAARGAARERPCRRGRPTPWPVRACARGPAATIAAHSAAVKASGRSWCGGCMRLHLAESRAPRQPAGVFAVERTKNFVLPLFT